MHTPLYRVTTPHGSRDLRVVAWPARGVASIRDRGISIGFNRQEAASLATALRRAIRALDRATETTSDLEEELMTLDFAGDSRYMRASVTLPLAGKEYISTPPDDDRERAIRCREIAYLRDAGTFTDSVPEQIEAIIDAAKGTHPALGEDLAQRLAQDDISADDIEALEQWMTIARCRGIVLAAHAWPALSVEVRV